MGLEMDSREVEGVTKAHAAEAELARLVEEELTEFVSLIDREVELQIRLEAAVAGGSLGAVAGLAERVVEVGRQRRDLERGIRERARKLYGGAQR